MYSYLYPHSHLLFLVHLLLPLHCLLLLRSGFAGLGTGSTSCVCFLIGSMVCFEAYLKALVSHISLDR